MAVTVKIAFLSTVTPVLLWAHSFYANIETQYQGLLSQQNKDSTQASSELSKNQLHLTLAEIGFEAEILPDWTAMIELQVGRDTTSQLSITQNQDQSWDRGLLWSDLQPQTSLAAVPALSRAEILRRVGESTFLGMGLVRLPEISSDRISYKPYNGSWATNRTLGVVLLSQGRHPGMFIESQLGVWHYQIALWQQTAFPRLKSLPSVTISDAPGDNVAASLAAFTHSTLTGVDANNNTLPEDALVQSTDFQQARLQPAVGTRLSLTQKLPQFWGSYGIGIGGSVAPLNQPIVVNTITQFQNDTDILSYSTISFNRLAQWACDASVALNNVQINMGYQYQKILTDKAVFFPSTQESDAPAQAFNAAGLATSLWVESGYLFGGAHYDLFTDYAAIAGVRLSAHRPAIELTGRYGMEHYRNLQALLDPSGFVDFSNNNADNATASPSLLNAGYQSEDRVHVATFINIDNTGNSSYQLQQNTSSDLSYEYKRTGWQISAAVFFADDCCLRLEYQTLYQSYRKYYNDGGVSKDSGWQDSLNAAKISVIKLGGQYVF